MVESKKEFRKEQMRQKRRTKKANSLPPTLEIEAKSYLRQPPGASMNEKKKIKKFTIYRARRGSIEANPKEKPIQPKTPHKHR